MWFLYILLRGTLIYRRHHRLTDTTFWTRSLLHFSLLVGSKFDVKEYTITTTKFNSLSFHGCAKNISNKCHFNSYTSLWIVWRICLAPAEATTCVLSIYVAFFRHVHHAWTYTGGGGGLWRRGTIVCSMRVVVVGNSKIQWVFPALSRYAVAMLTNKMTSTKSRIKRKLSRYIMQDDIENSEITSRTTALPDRNGRTVEWLNLCWRHQHKHKSRCCRSLSQKPRNYRAKKTLN